MSSEFFPASFLQSGLFFIPFSDLSFFCFFDYLLHSSGQIVSGRLVFCTCGKKLFRSIPSESKTFSLGILVIVQRVLGGVICAFCRVPYDTGVSEKHVECSFILDTIFDRRTSG